MRGPVRWDCELRYHGEWGVEARILRQDSEAMSRRFTFREGAVEWANMEREELRIPMNSELRPAFRLQAVKLH
jgi:hypothetical protein